MLSEGQTLHDTYRLVRLIGEGGMGLVFEATHARLSGRYAVKVLHEKLWGNPEALARFDREARVTSSLQHPNIVQVVDFNTASDGTEYLVMEFLDGETLAKRLLWQRRLTIDQVVQIGSQIAAALSAAHAQGVVHRDLKPDNVLLVPVDGRVGELVKVLDFGISKVNGTSVSLQGKEGTLFGTPQYMAPEQCQGRVNDVGPASDQFALAAICYELLTGRPAFWGDSLGDILSHIIYDQPAPMHAGAEVEAVVLRGLAKSPADRYPSIAAFAQALRTAGASPSRALCELPTLTFGAVATSSENFGAPIEGRRRGLRRIGGVSTDARRMMVVAGVLLCVGATLAVGHAQGGSGWLAARRSAAAERAPLLPTPEPPPSEPAAVIPTVDDGARASAENSAAAEDSIAWRVQGVAQASAVASRHGAPTTAFALADGRRPAARSRRAVDRPSAPVVRPTSRSDDGAPAGPAAPTEPAPLAPIGADTLAATEAPANALAPSTPDVAVAPAAATAIGGVAASPRAGADPSPHRSPLEGDAPLPLGESGSDADGNRPLGLVE